MKISNNTIIIRWNCYNAVNNFERYNLWEKVLIHPYMPMLNLSKMSMKINILIMKFIVELLKLYLFILYIN